jgi:hypothetical protein
MQKKIEFVKLTSEAYSENKAKIKKIFKDEGLIFNRGKYLADGKFIWENDKQSIELIAENENSILRWESDDFTSLYEKLKIYTTQLNGEWSTKKIEPIKLDSDLIRYDNKYMNKFIQHEKNARVKGFKHCPILKPMIKEYLDNRKEEFNVEDKTVEEILNSVYKSG